MNARAREAYAEKLKNISLRQPRKPIVFKVAPVTPKTEPDWGSAKMFGFMGVCLIITSYFGDGWLAPIIMCVGILFGILAASEVKLWARSKNFLTERTIFFGYLVFILTLIYPLYLAFILKQTNFVGNICFYIGLIGMMTMLFDDEIIFVDPKEALQHSLSVGCIRYGKEPQSETKDGNTKSIFERFIASFTEKFPMQRRDKPIAVTQTINQLSSEDVMVATADGVVMPYGREENKIVLVLCKAVRVIDSDIEHELGLVLGRRIINFDRAPLLREEEWSFEKDVQVQALISAESINYGYRTILEANAAKVELFLFIDDKDFFTLPKIDREKFILNCDEIKTLEQFDTVTAERCGKTVLVEHNINSRALEELSIKFL
ncbi:MAG: hypothetical protein PHE67_00330 [Campylobacterales bacterium]|nr:hypothetical protein [Campylobacterales bacterium]